MEKSLGKSTVALYSFYLCHYLSPSVLVISVTVASPSAQVNMSFIFISSSSLYWPRKFFAIRRYSEVYILGHFYVLDKPPPPQFCLLYRLLVEYG